MIPLHVFLSLLFVTEFSDYSPGLDLVHAVSWYMYINATICFNLFTLQAIYCRNLNTHTHIICHSRVV